MAEESLAAQQSPRALRKFGLTVGGVFLLLGAVSRWRGHEWPPLVLWVVGGLLVVPGAVAPTLLGPVERGWMRMAAVLGHFNARVILTVLFYVVMTPIAWVVRLGRDPMDRRLDDGKPSNWIKRAHEPVDVAHYRRQF
ncbi:MAG: SxtJ family membrane protein [Candidatus Binatia bacterium]